MNENRKRKGLNIMQLLYEGKTKDVYELPDGNVLLQFKDDLTGEDGVFDPGANTVGLTMDGAGEAGLRMTAYYFEKLQKQGIPTQLIEHDADDAWMKVKPAKVFGDGLEVICRYRAVGSFYRRYGAYCEEGQKLDGFVEVTLKDDERGDPPVSKQALMELGILSVREYQVLETLTKQISSIIKEDLAAKGLELYDIKLEFGRNSNESSNEIMLIDELSGGNMRVYDQEEKVMQPIELAKAVLA